MSGPADGYDPRHRYRVYRVDADGGRHEIASTGTKEGIGTTLVTLRAEQEWDDFDRIGVLDTEPRSRGRAGLWIVNPFAKGRR